MSSTLWGYGRASTHEQQETLLAQQARIEKEYKLRFQDEGLLWGGVFLDPGVSGSKRLSNRPQGLRLCQALNEGDVVVITKLDRGFRNCADLIKTLEIWSERNIRLVALDHNMDTGSPVGRLFVRMLAIFAEFERERICERIHDALNSMRARGIYPNGNAPYGFIKTSEKKLAPDHSLRRIASTIIDLCDLKRMTYEEVYWYFRQNGVKRVDGSEISCRSVARYYRAEKALRLAEANAAREDLEEGELDQEISRLLS